MAMSGHAQLIADLLARHDLPAPDAGKSRHSCWHLLNSSFQILPGSRCLVEELDAPNPLVPLGSLKSDRLDSKTTGPHSKAMHPNKQCPRHK